MAGWRYRLNDVLSADQAHLRVISSFISLGEVLRFPQRRTPEVFEGADILVRAIESEIIPRLMLAHSRLEPIEDIHEPIEVSDSDRSLFVDAVICNEPDAVEGILASLLDRGVTRQQILLDLVAAAARRLGEMWEEDAVDFTLVTIALCKLHEVVRELGKDRFVPAQTGLASRDLLLSTARADQHSLGVMIVGEFFRDRGWNVRCEPGASADDLTSILAAEHFDVLGLSVSCARSVDGLPQELVDFRAASKNADLRIFLGGRLISESPQLANAVGADRAAVDLESAVSGAESLLADVRARH